MNGPIAKAKEGNIEAALWKNDKGHSVSLQKSWKKKEETDWHREKMNLFRSEVENAITVLQKVLAEMPIETKPAKKPDQAKLL